MNDEVRITIDGGYDEALYCQEFGINTQEDAEDALANIHNLWEQNRKDSGMPEASLRRLAESSVEKFKSGEFPLPPTTNANGNTIGRIAGQPPASEKSAEEANPPVKPQTAEEAREGDSWLDGLQAGLDVAGLAPGFGAAADVLNAGIYLFRGDYASAGFALFCAIPGVGDVAAAGKLGLRAIKTTEKKLVSEIAEGVETIPVLKPTGNTISKNKEIDLPVPLISGGIIKGISTPAPEPKGRCQLKPYDDADCGEGMDAHHVTPNRVFQLSSRKANELMPGGVPEGDGLTICLESNKLGGDAEHIVAHRYYDAMEKALKTDGITPDGGATLEQIEDAAADSIEKATNGMCKKEDIKKQLREYHQNKYGLNGKTLVRASKHPKGIRDIRNNIGKRTGRKD